MKGNKGGIQKNAKGKTKIDYIFITIIVVEVIFIIILFTIPTIKDWLYKEFEYYWIAPLGTILVAIPSIYVLNKRATKEWINKRIKGLKEWINKHKLCCVIAVELIVITVILFCVIYKEWLDKNNWYYIIAPLGTILVAIPSIYILNKRAQTAEKQVKTMIEQTNNQTQQLKLLNRQTNNQTRQLEHELLKNGIEHLASENIAIRLGAIIELKGLHGTTIWEQAFNVLMSFVRTSTKEEEYINKYVQITKPKPREDIQTILNILSDDNYKRSIPQINLAGAQLVGADVRDTILKHADCNNANFKYAKFPNTSLESVYLKFANLEGANLQYTNLKGANLQYTNLKGAKIMYKELGGAKYTMNTKLQGADFEGAIMIDVEGVYKESIKSTGAINTDKIIWTEEELEEAKNKYPDKYRYLDIFLS